MWKWSAPSIDEAIVYWKYGTKNEIVITLISPRTRDLRVIKLVVRVSCSSIQQGVPRDDFSITWNYGIGFTYDTAIGPIRLEYAIPYTTSLTSNETVHASILYMF